MSRAPANPSRLVASGFLLASIAVSWFFTTIGRMPAWQVSVKSERPGAPPVLRTERNGFKTAALRGPGGEPRWEVVGADWRLFLPEPIAAMRSDWRVRVEFTPEAAARPVTGISLRLNGRVLREGLTADRPVKLTIPFEEQGPGPHTLELKAAVPLTFQSLRVRNYFGLHLWFSNVCVIGRSGPYWRPDGWAGLPPLALLGGIGAAALAGLSRWARTRLQVPVWTPGQWARTAAAPAVTGLALSAWNLFGPVKVLVADWSAVVLLAGWLTASGLCCAWRNLKAVRWPGLEEAQRQRWLERRRAVLLVVAVWLAYNSNMARIGTVDGHPPPLMAISLLRDGDLDLDEYRWAGVESASGHWVSRWTPGSALFCVPFFLIPTWLGIEAPSTAVDALAKLTGSTVTALSAAFVYGALRRLCAARSALWLTLAYALGTASFAVSSQDTWQHGPSQLCVAIALYALLGGEGGWLRHYVTGFFLGMVPVCRPTSAVFALALLAGPGWRHGWRAQARHALGALVPVAFLAAYNLHYFGTVGLAGYADIPGGGWIPAQIPVALAGLLISPNRGMLVFSPFLLMLGYGWIRGLRHPERPWRLTAAWAAAAVLVHLIVTAAWKSWHGIFTFGCRYSADALPFWCLLGGFGMDRLWQRPGWRRLLVALVIVSILIQSLGVYIDQVEWNWMQKRRLRLTVNEASAIAWDLEHPQIVWNLRFLLGLEKSTVHPDW